MKHFILLTLGFFILIGTAGAIECNNISILQGIIQGVIGFAILGAAEYIKG